MSDVIESVETKTLREKVILKITGVIGYLLPLASSMPPLMAWGGFMTIPFAVYLLIILLQLNERPLAPNLHDPISLYTTMIQIIVIIFLVWSIIYLRRNKSEGLVSSGPYGVVRHPQYFSLIVLTLLMAYHCILHIQSVLGGMKLIEGTKITWIGMLVAYVIIAKVEELYLKKSFETEWTDYNNSVGFLIPFLKHRIWILEILSGIIVPYTILEIALFLSA